MSYAPGVNYDSFIKYNISKIEEIFIKLDKIDALTDNPHVKDKTEDIRKILNKQQ